MLFEFYKSIIIKIVIILYNDTYTNKLIKKWYKINGINGIYYSEIAFIVI